MPKTPPPISDSERGTLDEIRQEREFAKRLAIAEAASAEKKKLRLERVRAWVMFASAVLVLKGALWDHMKSGWEFVAAHWK